MAKAPKPVEHEEGGKAPEKGHDTARAKPNFVSRTFEAGWSGTKKVVGGLRSYFGQLVRGTLSGAWKATGGALGRAVMEPLRHIGKSFGDVATIGKEILERAKERHHIGKLAPAIRGIALATAMSVGNLLYLPASPFVGAGTSVIEGAENVGSAIVMRYDKHKGAGEADAAIKTKGNGGGETSHG